ncbi:Ig-like domain-containing protein [Klebsiella aerogenes]|uniref:Ig-like domain-containing protein n=1 Tax=Klebsiella aerogenes TaxID=548 RepID=UPI0037ACF90E
MESKAINVVVIDGKKVEKTITLQHGQNNSPVIVDAVRDGKYLLAEKDTGFAPENITARRVGDDLYITFEGEQTDTPDLIVRDYYMNEGHLVGKGEDGAYYNYVTAYGQESAAITADTSAPLALGQDSIPDFTDGLVAQEDHDNTWLWALLGFGALAAGGIIALTHDDDNGSTTHSSSDDTTVKSGTLDSITDNAGSVTGPVENGGVTDDNTPTMNGSGVVPGYTVVIRDGDGTIIGSTTADSNGNWTFTPDQAMSNGTHDISVIVIDDKGNQSAPSNDITIIIDTVAPGQATVQVTDESGQDIHDSSSNDASPTISGGGEPGAIVIISDGGEEIGSVQVDENGEWNFTPTEPMDEGDHTINVVVIDDAGNVSPPSEDISFNIDTTTPEAAKDLAVIDDAGEKTGPVANGDVTDDSQPEFNGTAEPGTTVIISDNGTEIGTVVVDENGNWSFTPDTPLADGDHSLSTEVVDDAGNRSEPSAPIEFVVDTVVPEPATDQVLTDDVGDVTGPLSNGDITDDTQPEFSGKAETGATVIISDNGTEIGSVVVDENGNWSYTPETPLQDGEHSLSTVVEDAAGNRSVPSESIDFTVQAPEPVPGSENFETTDSFVFDEPGTSLTLDSGMTITFVDGRTDGAGMNAFTEISSKGMFFFAPDELGEKALMLIENSETKFEFGGGTNAVSFDVNASSFEGSTVNYYDASGNLLNDTPVALPVQADGEVQTISFVAPEGEQIAWMTINTGPGSASNVITRVDNFAWGDEAVLPTTPEAPEAYSLMTDGSELDYSAFSAAAAQNDASAADHAGAEMHGDSVVNLDDLLSNASQDLFIADGKHQVAIESDAGSHITLDSASFNESSWTDAGQTTAGGVTYNVYQQQDGMFELLVQQGVELQHA